MLEFTLNQAVSVDKVESPNFDVPIYVIDNFLANPEALVDYANTKAYFGEVGADRTAYPGIRDRLLRPYDRVLESVLDLVYGNRSPSVHRCMLSLTTLSPKQLQNAQKIPHVDTFAEGQFAAVHYLCDESHGGTAFYRYLPRNIYRLHDKDKPIIKEMIQGVRDYPDEHAGYLTGNTNLFRQEVLIKAKFNRLVLYPSNVLHCAQLDSGDSFRADVNSGRLSVASFFELAPVLHQQNSVMARPTLVS